MNDQEIIGPGDRFDDPFDDEPFEEPRRGMSTRAKLFAGTAICLAVVAIAAVGWFAFQEGVRSGAEEAAPVIQAGSEPVKRKPENPGGLDVPHQDKLVFNRLAPGQVQEPVERLLPPPEEPVERPQATEQAVMSPEPEVTVVPERPQPTVPQPPVPASPEAQTTGEAAQADPEPEVVVETAPPPPPPPPVALEPEPEPEVAAAPEPATEPAKQPEPARTATPSAQGAWKVQMASVSSRAAADREWTRLQTRYGDLLGSMSLSVESVALERGTFYRVQAGSLADRATASELCGKLKSRNQDCLVVAP